MSGPGTRRPLSELIPGSAAALRPKPAKTRQARTVRRAESSYPAMDHNHWSWKPCSPSCPAYVRCYGPASAVGRAARLSNLSVEEWLREAERRRRDRDPQWRELNDRLGRLREQLQESKPGR